MSRYVPWAERNAHRLRITTTGIGRGGGARMVAASTGTATRGRAVALNRQLENRAQDRDSRRLAVSAHEIGHAISAVVAGIEVDRVYLTTGMFGGVSGGRCEYADIGKHSTTEAKKGYLVSLMAGHAAEIRFCRLYLGMDQRAAYRYGRDWADGDYHYTQGYREAWHLPGRYSVGWAFAEASELVNTHGDYLDRLTIQLDKRSHLDGRDL